MKKLPLNLCAIYLAFITIFFSFTSYSNPFNKDEIIDQTQDEQGGIWIYEKRLRCLSFIPGGQVVQTCINLNSPNQLMFEYPKMLMGLLYLNNNPQKILLIGLGGGVLPKTLNKLLPDTKIDIVEINNQVLTLAKKYFDFAENDNLKVFIADGVEFIKNKRNSYDLIIIDAMDADYIPSSILTTEFINSIKSALGPKGIVAINTFKDSNYTAHEADLFNNGFRYVINLVGETSRIIIASDKPFPVIDEIKKQSITWEEKFLSLDIDTNWLVSKFGF